MSSVRIDPQAQLQKGKITGHSPVESPILLDAIHLPQRAFASWKSAPGHPVATLFLGIARRFAGDAAGSIEALEPLARSEPNSAAIHYELGRSCGNAGRGEQAIAALRRIGIHGARATLEGIVHAAVLRRPGRMRQPRAGPNLHSRRAASRLDVARTDSVEPL